MQIRSPKQQSNTDQLGQLHSRCSVFSDVCLVSKSVLKSFDWNILHLNILHFSVVYLWRIRCAKASQPLTRSRSVWFTGHWHGRWRKAPICFGLFTLLMANVQAENAKFTPYLPLRCQCNKCSTWTKTRNRFLPLMDSAQYPFLLLLILYCIQCCYN